MNYITFFLHNCETSCIHELTKDSDSGRMSMITFHSLGGLRRKIRTKLMRAAVTKAKKKMYRLAHFPQVAQIDDADLSHSNGNFVLYIDFQVY